MSDNDNDEVSTSVINGELISTVEASSEIAEQVVEQSVDPVAGKVAGEVAEKSGMENVVDVDQISGASSDISVTGESENSELPSEQPSEQPPKPDAQPSATITLEDILLGRRRSPDDIAKRIISNVPTKYVPIVETNTLTYLDFEYRQSRASTPGGPYRTKGRKPGQLVVKLYPSNLTFGVLAASFNCFPVKHKIPGLPDAPSLEQWFTQLLVDYDDIARLSVKESREKLFQEITENFNKRLSDDPKDFVVRCRKPVAFLTYEGLISIQEALQHYGQLYQKQILSDPELLSVFKLLHQLAITRDRRHRVMLVSHKFSKNSNFYKMTPKQIGSSNLLAEMLVAWPNLVLCPWNSSPPPSKKKVPQLIFSDD